MEKRSSKQIARDVTTEKYQTPTYFKRPPYWVRKSRILWISFTALGMVWLALSFVGGGWVGSRIPFVGESIFMNGPLIDAHSGLTQDCRKCHTAPFSHVKDKTCLECHDETIGALPSGLAEHHLWKEREMAACSSCHIEHQGDIPLRKIEDRHCTVCHANFLHTSRAYVTRFSADPDDHPEIEAVKLFSQGQEDPGNLKFNHKLHLADADGGVLAGAKEDIRSRRILHCEDCHVPDNRGDYYKPVVYEEHCGTCHAHVIYPLEEGRIVPHDSPSRVREFLLRHYYESPPKAPALAARRRRYVNDEQEFEKAVRAAVDGVERILYHTGSEEICAQCHHLVKDSTSTISDLRPLPSVTNPDVPLRWMGHARFNHKTHIQIKCKGCHGNVGQSDKSGDILFAPISVCASCHSPGKETPSSCALCHTFHPEFGKSSQPASDRQATTRGPLESVQDLDSFSHATQSPRPVGQN